MNKVVFISIKRYIIWK